MSTKNGPSVRVPLIVFAGSRSVPAQLWRRQGSSGKIWCLEPLNLGLRCDVMLEGISAGVPVLVRIEVSKRSAQMTVDGELGYLHLVELAFLRPSDQRTLDVWMRAAKTRHSSRGKKRSAGDKVASSRRRRPGKDSRRGRSVSPTGGLSSSIMTGARRVLLAEGGRSHAEQLAQALDPDGRDVVVESIWTLSELKGRLAVGQVHLVLLDPDLPDSRGLATVQEAVKAAGGVPVVVLAGRFASGFEVQALLAGAARVMRQDSIGPELARRIQSLLGVSPLPRVPVPAKAKPVVRKPARPAPSTASPSPEPRAIEPPPPEPPPPEQPDTLVAELWWHQDGYAAIWCGEALRIGLRCELLLDPEESGRPQLFRVEVVRAHHKSAPDGRNGYLHEATMVLAPVPEAAPVAEAPALRPAPEAPAPRLAPEPPRSLTTPFRVVLVENNPSHGPSPLRSALGRIPGVLIETRSSLAGLRARARRDDIHLVLIELDLPSSPPPDTAKAARGFVTDVPIVGLGEALEREIGVDFLDLGLAAVISMDSERDALHALIEGFRAR